MKIHYKLTLYGEGNFPLKREYVIAVEKNSVHPQIFKHKVNQTEQSVDEIRITSLTERQFNLKVYEDRPTKLRPC